MTLSSSSRLNLAEIRLDLDRKWSGCGWVRWCERFAATARCLNLAIYKTDVRETRRGVHVYVFLQRPVGSSVELVALQAILGSDSMREAMNLRRALTGRSDAWNVLHEVKVVRKAGSRTVGVEKPRPAFRRILDHVLASRPPSIAQGELNNKGLPGVAHQ
jgi:hypothetical protein